MPNSGYDRSFRERKFMAEKPTVVLTIAGFDPSSGAGVTADIKTIAAHGCYGVSCITALTIQSTSGVRRVEPTDPGLVADTLEELDADLEIAAVHIGMPWRAGAPSLFSSFFNSTVNATPAKWLGAIGRMRLTICS